MIGGLLKSASRLALVAAAGVLVGGVSAQAADLSGDCCADLEERVAELEATTARKGNRKVSLTVSGWVNEAIMFWNDGREQNTYVATNQINRTRFRFVGEAKINPEWSAGYLLEIGIQSGSRSDNVNRTQDDTINNAAGLDVRHSAWWIDNKTYGRVWVGMTSNATAGLNGINLSQVADHDTIGINNLFGGFQLRTKTNSGGEIGTVGAAGIAQTGLFASAVTMGNLRGPLFSNGSTGFGEKFNLVKYVSPTIMGFIFSASWGEDDMWDVALRYAGEFSGFKIAAGVGVMQWTDGNITPFNPQTGAAAGALGAATAGPRGDFGCASAQLQGVGVTAGAAIQTGGVTPNRDVNCTTFQAGASVMHVPTGLYFAGSYGRVSDKAMGDTFNNQLENGVDSTNWAYYLQAGIEQSWFRFGKTGLVDSGFFAADWSGADPATANCTATCHKYFPLKP